MKNVIVEIVESNKILLVKYEQDEETGELIPDVIIESNSPEIIGEELMYI